MAEPPPASSDQVWIGDLPEGFDDEAVKSIFASYGEIVWSKAIPAREAGKNNAALIQFATIVDAEWMVENLNGNIPEGLTTPIQVQFSKPKSKGAGKDKGKDKDKGKGKGKESLSSALGPKGGVGKAAVAQPVGKGSFGKSSPVAKGAPSPYDAGKGKGSGKDKGAPGTMRAYLKSRNTSSWGSRPVENSLYVKGLPPDCTDRDMYDLFAPFGAIEAEGASCLLDKLSGQCTGIGFVDYVEAWSAEAATQALNGFENLLIAPKQPHGKGKGKGKSK